MLCLLALLSLPAFAATAPDSVAGKIYHEWSFVIRSLSDFTVRFDANGRYHFLKNIGGSLIQPDGSRVLLDAPDDGTYSYTRTGPATGVITLSEPGGTLSRVSRFFGFAQSASLSLGFETDFSGNSGAFYFTEASPAQPAPVLNVSLRGFVDAGKALIAGITIAGDPANSAATRGVLIRVIGPGLSQFGVSGVWADPDFQLYSGAFRAPVGAHFGDWAQEPTAVSALRKIFATVGAFPLSDNAKDSAAIVRLSPGSYTIVAGVAPGDVGGEALIEVYFLP